MSFHMLYHMCILLNMVAADETTAEEELDLTGIDDEEIETVCSRINKMNF